MPRRQAEPPAAARRASSGDVDAVDVHVVISAFCVFRVANRHTFRHAVRA